MILYKARRKIKRWVRDNFRFYKTLFLTQFNQERRKKVFLEIDEIALNRYLYNFIKFFTLNGYTVFIPKNKEALTVLNRKKGEFIYGSWILKERVKLGKPEEADLVITKDQLSNDYFGKGVENSYYVPMSEYPGMYRNSIQPGKNKAGQKRKKSVFMSGNIDPKHYNKISKAGFFKIASRSEVAKFIQEQPYYYEIGSHSALRSFIDGKIDHKAIIINSSKQFRIPLNNLKEVLQEFHFYLALPGIFIPQSHNLVEAMSMGCIPIIHKTYAQLMYPSLKHMETALVYDSLEELDQLILKSFSLEESQIDSLKNYVLEYYDCHLSPKAVVRKIEENDFSKIYIQAENISLKLLEFGRK